MFTLIQWAKWLNCEGSEKDIAFSGVSIDSRSIKPGELFVAIKGEHFDGYDFIAQAKSKGAIAVLVDRPTTELPFLEVSDTRLALGQAAAAWLRELNIIVAAVTGSNGKTTVKEMLASILCEQFNVHWSQGNLNNDYGLPLTLLKLTPEHQRVVLEMGANHPGEIAYLTKIAPPNIALITNVSPAHTEGFGSVEGIARSKAEIYQGLTHEGVALINLDDNYANYWQQIRGNKPTITFGLTAQAQVWGRPLSPGQFELHTPQGNISISLQLLGEHNIRNAVAASAAAYAWQVPLTSIKAGLEKMQPVKGRLALHKGRHGNWVIDDTYNANPGSVAAAIKVLAAFPGTRILVLGDMRELGDQAVKYHREVGQLARQYGIDYLLAYGDLSQNAVAEMDNQGYHFSSQNGLIAKLNEMLTAQTVVLVKGSRSMKMENVVVELIIN
ncbi:MAG: murF [Gammaproteobacteria bacterium]|jgi:UDP-N-acetylmuramoyl-tripeptide--D-alanyl-D-alanine ligase|nr:murF [Gammaproteobacteria bacterium]